MSSEVASSSSTPSDSNKWIHHDTALYKIMNQDIRTKIAGFDFDGNLAKTKSGSKFCTGPTDWQFWQPCVPEALKKCYEDGYLVVIISNQMGISKGHITESAIMGEFDNFQKAVGIPIDMYVATSEDGFRKPSCGLWELLVEKSLKGTEPNLKESFYVGDAGGRPANSGQLDRKKDHSCSDRKFAINVGVDFYTPEEYFLKNPKAQFVIDGFDPRTLKEGAPMFTKPSVRKDGAGSVLDEGHIVRDASAGQEMVLLVGSPASGKSTFTKRFFLETGRYEHINRDTLKDMKKCAKAATAALESGKSVVIDNTNPKKADRAQFISIAKAKGVPVRVFWFQFTLPMVQHMNTYRERLLGVNAPHIPLIAIRMYFSKFEEPTLDEGVEEITEVNFSPKFDDERSKRLFYQLS